MTKKRVLKITPVLVTLNILVLLIIIGFYTFRLIKYYKIEHSYEDGTVLLVDEIIKKQSYLDDTKGLVFNDKTKEYRYKGEVKDNYVLYSGFLYRIVSIDENKSIKMVSEDNVTLLYPGFDNGFEKSYVNKWLNEIKDVDNSGVYNNILINNKSMLDDTTTCEDVISDVNKITCEKKTTKYRYSLLSLYDYKEAGGKNSYLNNGTTFYLGSFNDKNEEFYVNSEGEVVLNQKSSKAITIKPVITVSGEVELLSGKGKKDNPYIIETHEITTLADTYIGNIISINSNNYKVVEILDNSVKVVSVDALKEEDKALEISFGGSNSAYASNNTVGKYLNKTFLDSLDIKDSVIEGNYYIARLTLADLDYTSIRSSRVSTKVGLLTLGEFFVHEVPNTLTILRGVEGTNMINVINSSNNFFADTISAKYNVRPAFYIDSTLKIESGSGTIDSPYLLGGNNEKEETKEE